MIYSVPVLGWFIGGFLHFSVACVLWWFWGDVANYLLVPNGLPKQYADIGLWMTFKVLVVFNIVKWVVVPKFVSVSNNNKTGSGT